jgi:acyl-CoA thioester hydrolase
MSEQPFPFATTIKVRFRDLDAMGHVNNAVYFTYMETARTEFFASLFDVTQPADVPVILGETCCRYHAPAHMGETLEVALGVSRIGTKSFEIVSRIVGGDGRLVATGRSTLIMYDYTAGTTFPIPDESRQRLAALLGSWSSYPD